MQEQIDPDLLEGVDAQYVDRPISATLREYAQFIDRGTADYYLEMFMSLGFVQGTVARGSEHRLSCFFSEVRGRDGVLLPYRYAGKLNPALEFTDDLRTLMRIVEHVTGFRYNSCLANLYRNGDDYIGWHSDATSGLVPASSIASMSLGAPRWFNIRNKTGIPYTSFRIRTGHGSMVIMGTNMQDRYDHSISAERGALHPRINLTFRCIRA